MSQRSMERALNIVTKWRVLFTGWQLGTRPKGDPEGDAVRDHRELSILLRVEVTALTGLLLAKGIVTIEELRDALEHEAIELSKLYSGKFPGVTATEYGLNIDPQKAAPWMNTWKP